jgi:hypothetical protein
MGTFTGIALSSPLWIRGRGDIQVRGTRAIMEKTFKKRYKVFVRFASREIGT